MPKHFDKAERVGLLGQNDPVFFYFRRSLRGIVLTTPLIYLNPYSGNRRLIALRTFSAVNCPVILKIAQIAQKFLTGHFTNEEPNSLVNPQRRPWTKKLTQCCLQNQPELLMKSADDQDPNRLTIGIRTIWRSGSEPSGDQSGDHSGDQSGDKSGDHSGDQSGDQSRRITVESERFQNYWAIYCRKSPQHN